jgi:glycosyltransferase involved in cell wall biosynthesis
VVPVKIAILGTRGVPARYGGFETFAAELSTRLASRGHEVSVYCREGGEEWWKGVQRIVLPSIPHKYLETVSHAFLSALDALRRGFDVILVCNAANAFVLPLLRARRFPVAINVDGIERRRRKWNLLGRIVYAIGETLSVWFANRVVADAEVIASYYREQHSTEPLVIPYGADFPEEADTDVLDRLGLKRRNYLLYVSRFEPENNPLEVVRAYENLSAIAPLPAARGEGGRRPGEGSRAESLIRPSGTFSPRGGEKDTNLALPPLLMVGQGRYAPRLVKELHRHAGDRILFPGAIYGPDYRTLQRNALLYIQATEVGGTHPAMIEAMGAGGAVLAHDTPENREVGGDAVGYFRLRPSETLSLAIRDWLEHAETREGFRARARARSRERFDWTAVTDAYERLFRELTR